MPDHRSSLASASVVIINYNTREALRSCLTSLYPELSNQVVVVDNASSDGSTEMVRAEFPWVTLLANSQNLGYGTAANQAVSQCTSNYVLLLNSDTRLSLGALGSLVRYLEQHPHVAIAGPRIVKPDGTPQPSCFPFPTPTKVLLAENMLGALLLRYVPLFHEQYLYGWSPRQARSVPWVLGAALAIRREPFASVGGFDESYFMYFEEADLCYHLHTAGWETHSVPAAIVVHAGAASTVQVRAAMQVALYQSLIRFYIKHYSARRLQELRLILSYVMLRNLLSERIRLGWTHEPNTRAQLLENRIVWRQILSELWRRETFGFNKNPTASQRRTASPV